MSCRVLAAVRWRTGATQSTGISLPSITVGLPGLLARRQRAEIPAASPWSPSAWMLLAAWRGYGFGGCPDKVDRIGDPLSPSHCSGG
jgi:hypothetical protein